MGDWGGNALYLLFPSTQIKVSCLVMHQFLAAGSVILLESVERTMRTIFFNNRLWQLVNDSTQKLVIYLILHSSLVDKSSTTDQCGNDNKSASSKPIEFNMVKASLKSRLNKTLMDPCNITVIMQKFELLDHIYQLLSSNNQHAHI